MIQPAGAAPRRLRAIQGSRFLIGLSLFLLHALYYATVSGMASTHAVELVVQWGRTGVTYFFALSGFVLTYAFARRMATPDPATLLRYGAARLSTITPLHLLGIAMMLPIYAHEFLRAPAASLGTLVAHLLLIHAWLPMHLGDTFVTLAFNTPAWSLSVLLPCYALLPAVLWFGITVARWRARTWVVGAALAWGTTALLAVGFGDDPLAAWLFHYFPLMRMGEFLGGVALAMVLLVLPSGTPRVGDPTRPNRWEGTLVELGVLAIWGATVWTGVDAPTSLGFADWNLPTMLLVIWMFTRERGLVSTLLSTGPFQRAGDLTIALALLHFPVVYYAQDAGAYDRFGVPTTIAGTFVLSLVVATVAYRFVEVPARRSIRARSSTWIDRHVT